MEYEVGKYYDVVCAVLQSQYSERTIIVPIFDLLHKDPQFGGTPYSHYHIDGRFATRNVQASFSMKEGQTNTAIWANQTIDSYWLLKEKVIKKLKCKRLSTGLISAEIPKRSKYWAWYNSMVGKSCAGKRCPHLGTEMLERNGQLVCPLHNLVGSKEKEIIIPIL